MRNLVRGVAVATAVVIALTGSGVLASAAVTPTDRAATNAYLQSEYALYVAEVRNAGAVQAIFQTTAQAIGRECRGVLAGAPQQEDGGLLSRLGLSPRARGEQAREEEQRTTIEEELTAATSEASHGPDRAAREAFAAAVAPLRWSDPRIAALVAEHSADSLTGLPSTPSGACGDMRAWAQSGYRTLSPGSKAFAAKLQARLEAAPTTGSLSSPAGALRGPCRAGDQAAHRAPAGTAHRYCRRNAENLLPTPPGTRAARTPLRSPRARTRVRPRRHRRRPHLRRSSRSAGTHSPARLPGAGVRELHPALQAPDLRLPAL